MRKSESRRSAARTMSKHFTKHAAVHLTACLFLTGALLLPVAARAQWKYDVTLTGYPQARWKALTSYIDKPALGDVTGDGVPEIIATSIFGDVHCVDGRTGQILWTYEDEHSLDLAIYICPALVDVDCDNVLDVISVTPQGNVICLNGRSGRKIWSYRAGAPIVFSPTAFDLDRDGMPEIAVSDLDGYLYVLSNTGKPRLKVKSEVPFYGAPAMGLVDDDPVILVSDRSGTLRCFDGRNGQLKWRFSPSHTPISTSPIFFEDSGDTSAPWKVLFGTDLGDAYLVNARTGAAIWHRALARKEALGDFSLGDLKGDGKLDLVCSTAGSRIVAAAVADGKPLWSKKLKVPVKEYTPMGQPKSMFRTILSGEPVLVDADADGKLDVIAEIRGPNNYIYCLRGSDARVIWNYGNKDLRRHAAMSESSTISSYQDAEPLSSFSTTVPVYSQPTPVAGDFQHTGKFDLIINDRDEIGLISIPLPASTKPAGWAKYVANSCNNMVNFSLPCLGVPARPSLRLTVEPKEVTRGASARLCWAATVAEEVVIDHGIGTVLAENCLTVVPVEDTTWHAVAKGCGGETQESVTLFVRVVEPPMPPPPPAIPRAEPWTLEDVFFEYDWYRLTPEAVKTLDEDIRKLKEHPEARITLEATCDERGSMIYNQYLAVARAESVQEYLLAHGIDPGRLEVRPLGETTRWDSRLNDQGWALNRRVHFILISR